MVIPVGGGDGVPVERARAHFRSAGARDGAHAKDEAKQKEILRRTRGKRRRPAAAGSVVG